MRQLLLLRHAKSSWDDPALSDHARPLNARGRRAAAAMAQAMRDLGLVPDIVLVSSARRTLQTLESLTPFDDPALIEPMDALYLAPWRGLLAAIQEVPETARSLLVIGHNPGLHELVRLLAPPGPDAFPTGALAELSVDIYDWKNLRPGGGELVQLVVPRELTG